ncbi:RibD family protein [Leptolyngbya sp. FACHB-261]|nr:RibD family protein [Leptolyngbya sp. FACHB-261]
MSADGKLSAAAGEAARFSSAADLAHLEAQVAQADAVLIGAGTLRAYGTTLSVRDPKLLELRRAQGRSPQPVQIACSGSGNLDRSWRFFRQPVPRWLLTTEAGAKNWQGQAQFERLLLQRADHLNFTVALEELYQLGLRRLVVLGGGILVFSLLVEDLIDELWLTVCPLLLGGAMAPTPVAGFGFGAAQAPRLELLSVELLGGLSQPSSQASSQTLEQPMGQELLLHYRVLRD